MKQFFILFIAILCIAGCEKKAAFSIIENDQLKHYAENTTFVKIEIDQKEGIAYKYKGTPESVFGLVTSDLEVLGGYIHFKKNRLCSTLLTAKGRIAHTTLLNRLEKSELIKDKEKHKTGLEKGNGYLFIKGHNVIMLTYNPFDDSTNLYITNICDN